MPAGFDRRPYPLDSARFIQEEAHTPHAQHCTSSHFLFPPGALGHGHAFTGVRQQREPEPVQKERVWHRTSLYTVTCYM
jgi:hypothetical protein